MAGIVSYGLHFAAYRLPHEKIAGAWETRSAKGAKAVACYDEDALTLACAAAQDLIADKDPARFGGVFFASTSSPFLEKSVSSFIANAHRIPKTALTSDFTNSRRAAASAVRAAFDAVGAGSADNIVVAAGDVRVPEPGGSLEQVTGDGGGALCIGKSGSVADLLAAHQVSDETYDEFRHDGDKFINEGDTRFAATYNFIPAVSAAIKGVLEKARVKPEDVALIAIASDSPKSLPGVVKKLGLNPDRLVPGYLNDVGYMGATQPIVCLAQALEKAKPGEKILWVAYGDGADAFLFQATDAIKQLGSSRVESALSDKRPLGSYEKYLKFRGVFKIETPGPEETPVLHWNEREWNLPLIADQCAECGLVYFPPQQACMQCGSTKDKKRQPIPRKGKIFTFTKDYLVANPDPPQVTTVITADNGARIFLQGTDFEDPEVKIDTAVEFQIRRLHDGGDTPTYYWKCRPVRG